MLNGSEFIVIDLEGFDNNNLIVKELSVYGKNYQDTLLFKPPQDFSSLPTENRPSIIFLTRKIHGIDWDHGFYPYNFIHSYFISLRFRFPTAIVFVKGNMKREFLSKFLKNVYDLEKLGCPPLKQLSGNSILSCENHTNLDPSNTAQTFWHCSKLKSCVAYQWLEGWCNANQSNANSQFERLFVSCSEQ